MDPELLSIRQGILSFIQSTPLESCNGHTALDLIEAVRRRSTEDTESALYASKPHYSTNIIGSQRERAG